jgi:hypothetical protein
LDDSEQRLTKGGETAPGCGILGTAGMGEGPARLLDRGKPGVRQEEREGKLRVGSCRSGSKYYCRDARRGRREVAAQISRQCAGGRESAAAARFLALFCVGDDGRGKKEGR